MDINQAFKLYDIRGPYPQIVDERLAFALGRGLSSWKRLSKVLVCCDTRESSPSLKEFLTDGFANSGVSVFDLGETPMPMFNFALTLNNYDLGVMVTASHISDNENGFKIILAGPIPLDQQELLDVKDQVVVHQNEPIIVPRLTTQKVTASDKYVAKIIDLVGPEKPKIKLALDATKSAVLTTIMVIMQKLGADFHFVNSQVSGNPLIDANRYALEKDVVTTSSDLGIIWDSDGDRVVFVDRQGKMIPLSFVLGVFGAWAVKNGVGNKVAVDVRAGLATRDLIKEAGGDVLIVPAWNTNIKFAIKENPQIVFGGETSGHFIFPDFYTIDDGILAALRFIRLFETTDLENQLQTISKKYFELPEKNLPCPAEKSVFVLEKLTQIYRSKEDVKISLEDGLTVFGPDYKFNLRQSATEPYLRLNLEARDSTLSQKILTEIESHLEL